MTLPISKDTRRKIGYLKKILLAILTPILRLVSLLMGEVIYFIPPKHLFFSHFSITDFTALCQILHYKGCLWVFQCSSSWCHLSHKVYGKCGLQFWPFVPCFCACILYFPEIFLSEELSVCFYYYDICCIFRPLFFVT